MPKHNLQGPREALILAFQVTRDSAGNLSIITRCPHDCELRDNRRLLHRANLNFDAARFPRVLHRTCLRGSTPA